MKINAPLRDAAEIPVLLQAGADEFYCGYNPDDWSEKYTYAVWMNRRGPGLANMSDSKNFSNTVNIINAAGKRTMTVFNAPCYSPDQKKFVKEVMTWMVDIGVAGFILSDIELIHWLGSQTGKIEIIVSSMAAVTNRQSARFYQDLGASRIILPRQLSVSEIVEIKQNMPQMEFEAFIINDGCVYEESFCSTTHALGAFCQQKWSYQNESSKPLSWAEDFGATRKEIREDLFHDALESYQKRIWYLSNCGNPNGGATLNGPCGLCAMHEMHNAGIEYVKVVGRESKPERKAAAVNLVHKVREKIKTGAAKANIAEYAKNLRENVQGCAGGYMCYYR